MKELKKLESWEVKLSGSFVTVTADSAKLMVGAADSAKAGTADKITPRNDIKDADFSESGSWATTPARTRRQERRIHRHPHAERPLHWRLQAPDG